MFQRALAGATPKTGRIMAAASRPQMSSVSRAALPAVAQVDSRRHYHEKDKSHYTLDEFSFAAVAEKATSTIAAPKPSRRL
jgi:hypothetical protein